MHRHWIHHTFAAALLFALLGLSAAGNAQVIRCTDAATGRVTYTDGECVQGQNRKEVAPRPTPEDIQRQHEQAQQALELQRERASQRQQTQAADFQQPVPAAPQPAAPAQSTECQRAQATLREALARDATLYDTPSRIETAQQNVDLACLSPAEYARLRQRINDRPPVYITPPVIVRPPPQPHHPPRKANPNPSPNTSSATSVGATKSRARAVRAETSAHP